MTATEDRPKTVLVINNNPDELPGVNTQLVVARVREAGLPLYEARSVKAVDEYADRVIDGKAGDVGLIITCGSPVVLTEALEVSMHVTKTTAAVLHFPNAPVVGICFGMQLVAQLYGGTLQERPEDGHMPGGWEPITRIDSAPSLLDGLGESFPQWASNYIFVDSLPTRFRATATDSKGRMMAMEHSQEHVYGVQFHPEVINDEVGDALFRRILGLAGQNRRRQRTDYVPGPLSAEEPLLVQQCKACEPWHCSAQCRLRRAVKDAAQPLAPGPAGQLGSRLAAARKEALARLQRDHCRNGGVTVAALEDAIRALGLLAEGADSATPASAAPPASPPPSGACEEGETCSPHDADLRLREAVREALRQHVAKSRGAGASGSSRGTSVGGHSRACSAATTAATLPAGGGVAEAMPPHGPPDASVSPHEADLRLRRCVQALLQEFGGGPELARALGRAKSDALAEVRKAKGAAAKGGVPPEALLRAEALIRESAVRAAADG